MSDFGEDKPCSGAQEHDNPGVGIAFRYHLAINSIGMIASVRKQSVLSRRAGFPVGMPNLLLVKTLFLPVQSKQTALVISVIIRRRDHPIRSAAGLVPIRLRPGKTSQVDRNVVPAVNDGESDRETEVCSLLKLPFWKRWL